MKTVSLSGSLRENVGKNDAKKNRKQGRIPCVIYGGKEQKMFILDEVTLKKYIWNPDVFLFHLDIDGNKHNAIIQELQFHPVTDRVVHIDFLEVTDDKPFKIALPVKRVGTAPGVVKGGKIMTMKRKLTVKGLLKDIPDVIEIDISEMEIGDSVKIKDMSFDNLMIEEPPTDVVVTLKSARAAQAMAAGGEEEEETEETSEEGSEKASEE